MLLKIEVMGTPEKGAQSGASRMQAMLFLGLGTGYMGMHTLWNSMICMLMIHVLLCILLYFKN